MTGVSQVKIQRICQNRVQLSEEKIGIETPKGIKLASRAAFGSIHLPSKKQVSGLAEEKEDKNITNLGCMH